MNARQHDHARTIGYAIAVLGLLILLYAGMNAGPDF
jgi:hypothetical protein